MRKKAETKALTEVRKKQETAPQVDTDVLAGIIATAAPIASGITPREKQQGLVKAVADADPRNAMEARLAAQTATLYDAGMRILAEGFGNNIMIDQNQSIKSATQLLRLANETAVTLDRLKRGGEQRVVVQHVQVNDGGQAAFLSANIQPRGGGSGSKEGWKAHDN